MRKNHNTSDKKFSGRFVEIAKLIPYILRHPKRLLFAFSLLILAKITLVTLPFILKIIVDFLESKDVASLPATLNLDSIHAFQSFSSIVITLIIIFGAIRLTSTLFGEIRDVLFVKITENAVRDISLKVFKHLHALDLSFHLQKSTGALARDIERGVSGISFLLSFLTFSIIPTIFEILLIVIVLSWNYDFSYSLVILVSITIYVYASVRLTEWRTNYVRTTNKVESQTNSIAIDSLLNYETVKYFNNEEFEAKKYDKQLSIWQSSRIKSKVSINILNSVQAFIITVSMIVMLSMAGVEVLSESMTLGDFVLINTYMMQLFLPLNFLGFVYREIKNSLANIEALFKLLRIKSSLKQVANPKLLNLSEECNIVINNLSFSYDGQRPILQNINFKITKGQSIALVGASGSGKSTLAKLLFRFYDINEGKININGIDINQLDLDSLRSNLGVVPQDAILFNDTIYNNIIYGNPEYGKKEVDKVVKAASLTKLIKSLPQGYQTIVGERGLKLSGGEKQRIAIARALLKNAKLIIFDEATSSLDSENEKIILKTINKVKNKTTNIFIAHRLSTIINCDQILVFSKGKIVERGKHQELINLKGEYTKMWAIQERKQAKINSEP